MEIARIVLGPPVIAIWKESLTRLLTRYDALSRPFPRFLAVLVLFFVALNLLCYWLAMVTAFPGLTFGARGPYYFKVQVPVGILGAVFDTLSFFATVFLARRALQATTSFSYVAHLSVDLLIAVAATFWVLFVFTVSGWVVHTLEGDPSPLFERSARYTDHALRALDDPTASWRNIYFGAAMGLSATLPTLTHFSMSLGSLVTFWRRRRALATTSGLA